MNLTQPYDSFPSQPILRIDFRTLFESAPGLYLVLQPDFRIVAVSDAYLRATMTAREDILGRGIFEVFPDNPADPNATGVRNLKASLERVLQSGKADAMAVQKYDVRRPEWEGGGFEERHWSPLNSPVIGPNGEVQYIIHRVEDVTEFIRLKQEGRQQEQMTEALRIRAEHMQAEMFLWAQEVGSTNERLRAVNSELARLYNQISVLMEQSDEELSVKEGSEDHSSSGQPSLTPEQMLARVGALIARYKRTEEQLRQSHKMEAIGRLAGGVAHDFNNLLTVILGYASVLRQRVRSTTRMLELEEIERAASRAALMTTRLLAFSRNQIMQPRVLDLNSTVSGMVELLGRLIGENVRLVTILNGDLGKVKADPSQIDQVIMNLAINARDAMPIGGQLIIETSNVVLGADQVRGLSSGSYVLMSVRDTGHGMDAETATRVFEPFFTTKGMGKGTGLGLSTALGIVEQSGGTITVQSKKSGGATFRVYLPRMEEGLDNELVEQPGTLQPLGAATVLLVEDEAPLRRLVSLVLTAAGLSVLEAANGEEALSLNAQHAGKIDLLMTDVVMPGISGPELAARLQNGCDNFRVLYLSGYSRDLIEQKTQDPCASFLPKPFTPRTLLSKVSEMLAAPGSCKAGARSTA